MSQLMRQRETLFILVVPRIKEDCALAPISNKTSMQTAITPTNVIIEPDTLCPVKHIFHAQSSNGIKLERQGQGNCHFDITRVAGRCSYQRPELLSRILNENSTIHQMVLPRLYEPLQTPRSRGRLAVQARSHPASCSKLPWTRRPGSASPVASSRHGCRRQYARHLRESGELDVDAHTAQAGLALL